MAFKDVYQLKDDGIYVFKGKFRDGEWWDHFFSSTPDMTKIVYDLMETVYNRGEHDGRKAIRNAVKEVLDIEF